MTNKVKSNKALKSLTNFFSQEGKILSESEYNLLGARQPILGATLNNIFGGYRGAISALKSSPRFGSIVKSLDKPEVKSTAKVVETKAPVEPIPAKKPVAAKPAKVEVEKKNG